MRYTNETDRFFTNTFFVGYFRVTENIQATIEALNPSGSEKWITAHVGDTKVQVYNPAEFMPRRTWKLTCAHKFRMVGEDTDRVCDKVYTHVTFSQCSQFPPPLSESIDYTAPPLVTESEILLMLQNLGIEVVAVITRVEEDDVVEAEANPVYYTMLSQNQLKRLEAGGRSAGIKVEYDPSETDAELPYQPIITREAPVELRGDDDLMVKFNLLGPPATGDIEVAAETMIRTLADNIKPRPCRDGLETFIRGFKE